VSAPVEEVVERGSDCGQQLGHWMCANCNNLPPGVAPTLGVVYLALCGIRKEYNGPAWSALPCVVCTELRPKPCPRCGH